MDMLLNKTKFYVYAIRNYISTGKDFNALPELNFMTFF